MDGNLPHTDPLVNKRCCRIQLGGGARSVSATNLFHARPGRNIALNLYLGPLTPAGMRRFNIFAARVGAHGVLGRHHGTPVLEWGEALSFSPFHHRGASNARRSAFPPPSFPLSRVQRASIMNAAPRSTLFS